MCNNTHIAKEIIKLTKILDENTLIIDITIVVKTGSIETEKIYRFNKIKY